jgi:hypothetical protein
MYSSVSGTPADRKNFFQGLGGCRRETNAINYTVAAKYSPTEPVNIIIVMRRTSN